MNQDYDIVCYRNREGEPLRLFALVFMLACIGVLLSGCTSAKFQTPEGATGSYCSIEPFTARNVAITKPDGTSISITRDQQITKEKINAWWAGIAGVAAGVAAAGL